MMSATMISVTVIITVACQFTVRHTWVWAAFPIGPVPGWRSMLFHQSQKPVSAAPSETMPPAMTTYVPATNASLAAPGWDPLATNEMTSNAATSTYETMGKSVRGGWAGLPLQPRTPRKDRPLNVTAGLIENSLAMVASLWLPSTVSLYHKTLFVLESKGRDVESLGVREDRRRDGDHD